MRVNWILLMLLSCCVVTVDAGKSFSLCNSREGLPMCASDPSDQRVTLNPALVPTVCPEVLCAWECQRDHQCLEFNLHSNKWTCDLYYQPPLNYQSATDCKHFQDKTSVYCQDTDLNPCQNGGSCYAMCHGYVCACQFGYIGRNCETCTLTALVGVNLALGKPTDQSSTLNLHNSSYAVDGMFNTIAYSLPWCTNTEDPAGGPNWWMVDLQHIILVGHVVLTNRADCCTNRLDYFIVGVTNTSSAIQPPIRGSYHLCGQYPTTAVGRPLPVYCSVNTPPSRYVIIQQPANGTGQLNICELEVYYGFNLASGKPATQSSTYSTWVEARAVDGLIGTCSNTADEAGGPNWLMVDLGHEYYSIGYVVLTNRANCCPYRLDNFIVGVTNTSSAVSAPVRGAYPLCGQYPSAAIDGRMRVNCSSTTPPGRYVIIQQPTTGTGQLTVCELEVYRNC